jgi:hypothetical protein
MRPRGWRSFPEVRAQAGPILYHGGPILPITKVAAIYWASNRIYTGGPSPGTTGTGSADGSLIGEFLRSLGGSRYFNINTTYYDQVSGGHVVQNVVTYTQFWAANTGVPPADGTPVSFNTIYSKIIEGLNSGALTYDPATVYAVFTAGNTNLGGGFGNAYCAFHGYFSWSSPQGSKVVIYAAQPYANQYPGTCTSNLASPNGDAAADREINTLAHEIEEATTDPQPLTAWFDAQGLENADKCAWDFGITYQRPNGGTANMGIGARHYLIQRNWPVSGGCFDGYGDPTAIGGLVANCGLCNPHLNAVTASGSTITISDNGGHTAALTLTGLTASGGLVATCQLCTPYITAITTTAPNKIKVTDNSGHIGYITLTGGTAAGGLVANCGLCNAKMTAMTGSNTNLIKLSDNGSHNDYIILTD